MAPTEIYGDRHTGLGKFYLDHRKAVAKIISSRPSPTEPGTTETVTGSAFFISDNLGISNKHLFAGYDRTQIKTSTGHTFFARVVAVDHDADLLMFQLLGKPDSVRIPHFKLAATGEMPKGSFAATINHVAGADQDVLAMGRSKGSITTRSDKNENRLIGRTVTDTPFAGGGSGGDLLNENGEVTGVLTIFTGRASFATRVEHVHAMRDVVVHHPPLTGHWDITSTFDEGTAKVRILRKVESIDDTLGGRLSDKAPFYMRYQDSDTRIFVEEQVERTAEIIKRREASNRKP
jgi:S1-C subfamily serine protease